MGWRSGCCFNFRTVGGFCKWVEYTTRETWYYKNIICVKDKGKEEKNDDPLTSEIDRENQVMDPILIPSDTEEEIPRASSSLLRRPSKRTNPFAIIDTTTEKTCKKSRIDILSLFINQIKVKINKINSNYRNTYRYKHKYKVGKDLYNHRNNLLIELYKYQNFLNANLDNKIKYEELLFKMYNNLLYYEMIYNKKC
ncbi:hypothetical protein H8356DRAFT_1374963 [Neocallimastix lanati (nom. inval.)]|uniref:Uncharacterized protein n=1 Tax=Neocallimastix californiae TaxID=1754190 RepID=A0A1Y2DGW0_9FUNG|nr:hypothetical protein H8356DRAFT_1374963 [Neocallimastix sp. JGI-2020a]ORY57955.1 hypothetical protein LY90DRAFT_506356 [Neocallimastix californiae]|eukprot:ORY57955.1 hypothetical protein LY90DRAFT_506356 [Neocallimastix californiae]